MADASALRPVTRASLHEVIAERLLSHIVQSDLRPGDRLPGERELARRLGVSRTSVRQAIVALKAHGVLEVRHGGGTFLRHLDARSRPFTVVVERRQRLADVLEARRVLEIPIAALAAQRRTESDLTGIQAGLELMATEIASGDIGLAGDAAFHAAVTTAAHSATLAQLMEHLAEVIAETRSESLSQERRPPRSLADHEAIAEAIRAADPDTAAEAMRLHLDRVADLRLFEWQPPGEDETDARGSRQQ